MHPSKSTPMGTGNGYYTMGTPVLAAPPDSALLRAFDMESHATMPWSTGLCHCFDDPRNCMYMLNIYLYIYASCSLIISLLVNIICMKLDCHWSNNK